MLHLLGMVLREIEQIPQTQLSMGLFTMCLLVGVKEKLLLGLLILGQSMFFIDAKKILSVIMGIYFLWAILLNGKIGMICLDGLAQSYTIRFSNRALQESHAAGLYTVYPPSIHLSLCRSSILPVGDIRGA